MAYLILQSPDGGAVKVLDGSTLQLGGHKPIASIYFRVRGVHSRTPHEGASIRALPVDLPPPDMPTLNAPTYRVQERRFSFGREDNETLVDLHLVLDEPSV